MPPSTAIRRGAPLPSDIRHILPPSTPIAPMRRYPLSSVATATTRRRPPHGGRTCRDVTVRIASSSLCVV